MSDGVNTLDAAAIRARCDAARDMVRRLCLPRDNIEHRDWLMSIPADEARDPDLLIAAALADVPALLDALAAVEAENAAILDQLLDAQADAQNLTVENARLRNAALAIVENPQHCDVPLIVRMLLDALGEAAPATREE